MPAIKPLTGKFGDFSGIVLKAAARGHAEAVRHYLDVNPDWLNTEGPHGRTLLWEAAYRGRTALVAELIERGADVNPLGSYYTPMLVELSALAVARRAGYTELVDLLIANGAVDDLYAACHRGDLAAVDAFLANDPEAVHRPSREEEPHEWMGWHPIHYAVAGGQPGVVKLLVGYGARVTPHLSLLVHWSSDSSLTRYLKSRAGEERGTGEVVEPPTSRESKPVDPSVPAVDRPDWMGFPPLVEACRGNHNAPDDPSRVRPLLKRGANVNVRDHKEKTPLHRASQAGFVKITALLLEHGAELEMADARGATPLFDAAHHGRTPVVRMLVDHGASLGHRDDRGETPLFAAARGGRAETFAALLELGCDPTLRNKRGWTLVRVVSSARHRTEGRERILEQLAELGVE